MQKGMLQNLADPKNIKAIGSHFAKMQIDFADQASVKPLAIQGHVADVRVQREHQHYHPVKAKQALIRLIISFAISLTIVICGAIILIMSPDPTAKQIAILSIGIVSGYWIK